MSKLVIFRGTFGSGKSSAIRRLMSVYVDRESRYIPKRAKPIGYDFSAPGGNKLFAVGHYESAKVSGGGDSIMQNEVILDQIAQATDRGCDVAFEKFMVFSYAQMKWFQDKYGDDLLSITLDVSPEDCIRYIEQRRQWRGAEFAKGSELKADVIMTHQRQLLNAARKLKTEFGVNSHVLKREEAAVAALEHCGWTEVIHMGEGRRWRRGDHEAADTIEGWQPPPPEDTGDFF